MADLVTNLICRPPRRLYDPIELGPASFHLYGTMECFRHDIVLSNRRGNRLQCSMYLPVWIGLDKRDLFKNPSDDLRRGSKTPGSLALLQRRSSLARSGSQDSRAGSDVSSPRLLSPTSTYTNSPKPKQQEPSSRTHTWLPEASDNNDTKAEENTSRRRRRRPRVPCVVYLHGNSGCRIDADDIVNLYLERGVVVFAFDFDGSGLSDGQFVSLGYTESQDLECVLDYLQGLSWISGIGLHGRSMGACTALKTASSDRYYHVVCGMVLDSCYTSVRQVMRELTGSLSKQVPLLNVPGVLQGGAAEGSIANTVADAIVEGTIDALRDAVHERTGFNLDLVDVMAAAKHCQCPVLIAHAEQDSLVSPSHSRKLAEVYGGPKTCVFFDGDHNSERTLEFMHQAADFLRDCFVQRDEEIRRLRRRSHLKRCFFSLFSWIFKVMFGAAKWVRYEEGRVSLRGAVALFVVLFVLTTIIEWSFGSVFQNLSFIEPFSTIVSACLRAPAPKKNAAPWYQGFF